MSYRPRRKRPRGGRQRCRHRLQGRPRSGNAEVRSAARCSRRSSSVDPGARPGKSAGRAEWPGAAARPAANAPTGSHAADFPAVSDLHNLFSAFRKYRLTAFPASTIVIWSRPERGALRNVTKRGAGCDGRGWCRRRRLLTRTCEAVWSWHPDAGVKFAMRSAGDGGQNARSTGEITE